MTLRLTRDKERILWYLSGRGNATAGSVSRALGIGEKTVRKTVRMLEEAKIFEAAYVFDELRLGGVKLEILISAASLNGAELATLEAEIATIGEVWFCTKTKGTYDYYISVVSTSEAAAMLVWDAMHQKFPGLVCKGFAFYNGWRHFGAKYLAGKDANLMRSFCSGFSQAEVGTDGVVIDQKDFTIINGLAKNPSITQRQLGDLAGISAPAVSARICKLESRKFIRDRVYRIANLPVLQRYQVLVRKVVPSIILDGKATEFPARNPNVTETAYVSGSWDYTIRFETREKHDLEAFLESLPQAFPSQLEVVRVSEILTDFKTQASFGSLLRSVPID
jgi:DNA-binding Lrp family transcriptional regulator